MNVIRATLNNKSYKGRRGRLKNAPMFHTLSFPPRTPKDQLSGISLQSISDTFTLHPLNINQGQVLSTAERNSNSSRSTEQAFRTPCLSAMFKNRFANGNNPEITNELVAECLNTSDLPPTASSNSKISDRQKELLRNVPPLCSGNGRKPRSSTSSGARPRSTPTHSYTGTPRTPRTPKTLSSLESAQNMIIAITEGRGLARGEVGISAMDIHCPYLILCQISDCQTYSSTLTKINVLHPTEILVPNTFFETQEKNKLFTLIRETFPQVLITTVQRRHFSDNTGLQHIQSLCLTECANVEMVVRQKFYALSATAALLKYIEFQKNKIFMPKSLRIEYHSPENVMSIDMKTAQKLELVLSLNRRGSKASLLGVLDHCSTRGGRRSLRANILQPPTTLDVINSRILSVTELSQNPALLHSLQSAVSKFHDVEQLLWLCVQVPNFKDEHRASELQTNFVLLLKTTLDTLPVLKESLEPAQTPYFKKVLKDLDNEKFGEISNTILEVVNEDAKTKKGYSASTFQRCFAIKTGVNGLLDVGRASYSDLVAKLHAKVGQMGEEFGLSLRTCSTSSKGFHIQLSIKRNMKFSAKDLPPVFIQVARNRNLITMTTEELVILNHRIKQILREIQIMSNVVMQELLRKLRMHISCLYQLCEIISELDLLISFAQVSSADNFVPPTFGKKMDIKSSRHPILDVISSSMPVANDVFASSEKNFHIITGPNMGGKSIYIKQVALLQVMAQIGCFVPAESAELKITKQIFSRMGFDDSIEYNASSFVMEMKEMQYILRSMGSECLVVIDELCRSTDCEEGTAVAWVLCEQLLQSKAFVFFTTHYHTLTKLQSLYPNVSNHQMVAEDGPHGRLVYTHKLISGVTKVAMYGLKLAQISALPASVLQRAQELSDTLIVESREKAVHDEKKTEAEEDQEYIKELLNIIEGNRFNISEVSKIQLKLRKRYGLEESDEHADFQSRNIGEIDVSENGISNTMVTNNYEYVHEDPRSPELQNNIQSNQVDSLSTRSKHSYFNTAQTHLQLIDNQNQTHYMSPSLSTSGPQYSLPQMSPKIPDLDDKASSSSNSHNRFHTSNMSSSGQSSSKLQNLQEYKLDSFKVPLDYNSHHDNSSLTCNRQTRRYSQNTPRMSSIAYFTTSNENITENSPSITLHPEHQNPKSIKILHNNSKVVASPSYSIKSPRNTQPLQRSPFITNTKHSHLIDNQRTPRKTLELDTVSMPPDHSPPHTSTHVSRTYLDSDHNSQIITPVSGESTSFTTNGEGYSQQRNDRQLTNQPESPGYRPHFMAEGFIQSPGSSIFSQPSGTLGRLSNRIPNHSPLSSRSNTPMVMNLYPSFDLVPRNLSNSNVELDKDGNFEE